VREPWRFSGVSLGLNRGGAATGENKGGARVSIFDLKFEMFWKDLKGVVWGFGMWRWRRLWGVIFRVVGSGATIGCYGGFIDGVSRIRALG